MSLPIPADPSIYSEQLPTRHTWTVDRDTGAGYDDIVHEALTWTDLSPDQVGRAISAAIAGARAGDVLTVCGVRVHVR